MSASTDHGVSDTGFPSLAAHQYLETRRRTSCALSMTIEEMADQQTRRATSFWTKIPAAFSETVDNGRQNHDDLAIAYRKLHSIVVWTAPAEASINSGVPGLSGSVHNQKRSVISDRNVLRQRDLSTRMTADMAVFDDHFSEVCQQALQALGGVGPSQKSDASKRVCRTKVDTWAELAGETMYDSMTAQDRYNLEWLESDPWAGDGECGNVSLTDKNWEPYSQGPSVVQCHCWTSVNSNAESTVQNDDESEEDQSMPESKVRLEAASERTRVC